MTATLASGARFQRLVQTLGEEQAVRQAGQRVVVGLVLAQRNLPPELFQQLAGTQGHA